MVKTHYITNLQTKIQNSKQIFLAIFGGGHVTTIWPISRAGGGNTKIATMTPKVLTLGTFS